MHWTWSDLQTLPQAVYNELVLWHVEQVRELEAFAR